MRYTFLFLSISLFAKFAYADFYYATNIENKCNFVNNIQNLYALFEPNIYICQAGYYLPAGEIECTVCLSGHTCSGGTFTFNETIDQGIEFTIPIVENVKNGCTSDLIVDNNMLFAKFKINKYTCAEGRYLPADSISCDVCLANSYCSGGTYTFNETVAQGIVSCASGLYAPTGMWESAQCGRILHIGDEVVYLRQTKKTTPALHIDIDNDGIADFFGNVTTADVPMHAGTERKLKLQHNGITYSVYDDTVNVGE